MKRPRFKVINSFYEDNGANKINSKSVPSHACSSSVSLRFILLAFNWVRKVSSKKQRVETGLELLSNMLKKFAVSAESTFSSLFQNYFFFLDKRTT
jgi:hypothetical protein